jgi:hypothetical protein
VAPDKKAIQSLRPSDFTRAFGRAEARFCARLERPEAEASGYLEAKGKDRSQKAKQIPFGDDNKKGNGKSKDTRAFPAR